MEMINSTTVTDTAEARARVRYVLVVFSFPLLVAGVLTLVVFGSGAVKPDDGIGHRTKYANFSFPTPGVLVADQFETSGRIESIPPGEVVYLVERVEGRFWPKQRIGSEPTNFFRRQYTEPGKGYKYTIELLSVNAAGEEIIKHWYSEGEKTGNYPGIKELDSANILARIRVVRQ